MAYECDDKLGLKLCEILGIDPQGVQRLIVQISVEELPTIYVIRQQNVLTSEQCRGIEMALQECEAPQIVEVNTLMADVIDDDTERAVQAAFALDTVTLPTLIPGGLVTGRMKSLIPGADIAAGHPTANLDCQLESRPALAFGGVWLDKRKVTITVRGTRQDVVTAMGALRDIFNSDLGKPPGKPFVLPSGAPFLFWEPRQDTMLAEDESTKAGRDVWQGILEALCWTERQR